MNTNAHDNDTNSVSSLFDYTMVCMANPPSKLFMQLVANRANPDASLYEQVAAVTTNPTSDRIQRIMADRDNPAIIYYNNDRMCPYFQTYVAELNLAEYNCGRCGYKTAYGPCLKKHFDELHSQRK